MGGKQVFSQWSWPTVLRSEHWAIRKRREAAAEQSKATGRSIDVRSQRTKPGHRKSKSGNFDTTALCFSGGGIRSAAFSLGAAQALEVSKVFERFDYLSTVSGGGYTGAALTAGLTFDPQHFPFIDQAKPQTDNETITRLRDYSNYLIPLGFGDFIQDIAILVRGWVAMVLKTLPVLLLFAAWTVWLHPRAPDPNYTWLIEDSQLQNVPFTAAFFFTSCMALLLFIAFGFWAAFRTAYSGSDSEFSGPLPRFFALGLIGLAILAFSELQPFILAKAMFHYYKDPTSFNLGGVVKWTVGLGAPFLAAVPSLVQRLSSFIKIADSAGATKSKFTGIALMWAAGLVLPAVLWAAYLLLCIEAYLRPFFIQPMAVVYVGLALFLAVIGMLLGANQNSLHGLYRDRIGTAFLSSKPGANGISPQAMKTSDLTTRAAPFHVINAALNIQGSPDANRRERNADFFHFSPTATGSASSGFLRTDVFERADKKLTLASAMAISGAAVSSNMGSASQRPFTATLALLNLRLGYWLKNPLGQGKPNFLYLYKEIFSRLTAKDSWLYLTDGGHIENLGLYAMLKRRCRLIMVIDAEADPEMTFGAFAKASRYARIDLGCILKLDTKEIATTTLDLMGGKPVSATGPHAAIGTITYDNGGNGILLYVKSSLTGDENNYVKDYARRYPAFPHEGTGDQFFSEEQFEAYRALGFHAVSRLFLGTFGERVTPPPVDPAFKPNAKYPVPDMKAVRTALGL